MLQAFVPNISSFSDVRCKCVYLDVAYVSHICLQVFHLDVAYVFAMVSSVSQVFLQVSQMHVSSVSFAFIGMLQVLHLNVSKVDRVLHLLSCLLLPRLGISSSSWRRLGFRLLLPLFSMLVTFRVTWASHERAKRREK
jgi:hypothetical protein